ncbi:conjugative transposon protein TraK [Chitinophaga lutea]|uniref:Conjugative transposon protein TraK n=1 Tax=Chitinophaga lutea TaxID=2488634 RepID=A0A3N4Q294_9BACT|nr:conjugative transposon protein TraK [Chitinophaga lutea]
MFQSFRNIDTAIRHMRLFALALTLANCLVCGAVLYYADRTVTRLSAKVYVIAHDKLLEAVAENRSEKLPVELRHHVTMFHQSFYSLEPDEKVIERNLLKAFYLADGSAKAEADNLRESGYYTSIIAGNISQQVPPPDSIYLDRRTTPWHFRYYGKLVLIRATSIVTRSLVTQGYLRPTEASDNNPHGFLIERWQVLENKDLQIEKR